MLRKENSELSRRIFVFHISLFSPIFNCVDSDPDPYSEYGSSLDPDPQHLFYPSGSASELICEFRILFESP